MTPHNPSEAIELVSGLTSIASANEFTTIAVPITKNFLSDIAGFLSPRRRSRAGHNPYRMNAGVNYLRHCIELSFAIQRRNRSGTVRGNIHAVDQLIDFERCFTNDAINRRMKLHDAVAFGCCGP